MAKIEDISVAVVHFTKQEPGFLGEEARGSFDEEVGIEIALEGEGRREMTARFREGGVLVDADDLRTGGGQGAPRPRALGEDDYWNGRIERNDDLVDPAGLAEGCLQLEVFALE